MAIEKIKDKEAIAYIKEKGLLKGFSYKDVWREEHANSFTVAKCMSYDLLTDIQDSLVKALEEGTSYNEWAKNIEKTMTDKGWWGQKQMTDPNTGETKNVQLGSPRRLETIYNVNMRQARSVGNYERGQSSKYHTKMMYRIGNSKKHREEHLRWDGLILPRDDPWWDTHMPPNGYNCKCTVRFLTEAAAQELEKKGKVGNSPIKTKAPEDIIEQYTNKRTGKTYQGVKGITPGFEYNPASTKKREQALKEALLSAKEKMELTEKEAKTMQVATSKYPNEKWYKVQDYVKVAKSRLKKDPDDVLKLNKEIEQARIMAQHNHAVCVIEEPGDKKGVKNCDAIVDGEKCEFKTITGTGKRTVRENFSDALKQANNMFLRIESTDSKYTKEYVLNEVKREIGSQKISPTGMLYLQLKDGSYFEIKLSTL